MLRSSLYQPSLNCGSCLHLLNSNNKKPACFANKCEIQDIMGSEDSRKLMAMVGAFIQVESLQDSRGYESTLTRIVNESGLNDLSISTLFKLKSILSEYRESKRNHGK